MYGVICMSGIHDAASKFFHACETGTGWDGCRPYCHANASFSAQADVLSEIETVEAYAEWMKNMMTPIPDGNYELKFLAADEERNCVAAVAVFHGTQTGPGGPGSPTGKTVSADYAYAMYFDGDKVSHVTKIWNDTISLRQLGWA